VTLLTFDVTEPIAPPVLADVDDFLGPFTFASSEGAADAATLSGYGLGGLRFQQGYPVPLRLHWLAPAEPTSNLELRLQLWHRPRLALLNITTHWFGARATPIATQTLQLAPGYPVANWSAGRLVSLHTALSIPSDATPGRADLTLTLIGPDSQPWTVAGSQRLTLGTLTIEERPVLRQLPAGLTPVQVDFANSPGEGQIGLRGHHIAGEVQPGSQLDLTYVWVALSRPNQIFAVFTHLLTADGQPVTQADRWLEGGLGLTNQWQPGEYIENKYTLDIPTDAPPGPYLLAVGLYDAANGERLHAFQEGQPLPHNQWLILVDGSR
jgi:hypothetical protein